MAALAEGMEGLSTAEGAAADGAASTTKAGGSGGAMDDADPDAGDVSSGHEGDGENTDGDEDESEEEGDDPGPHILSDDGNGNVTYNPNHPRTIQHQAYKDSGVNANASSVKAKYGSNVTPDQANGWSDSQRQQAVLDNPESNTQAQLGHLQDQSGHLNE
jgi:hypothetical protein